MPFGISGKLDGMKQSLASLAGLGRTVRNQILRKALDKATQPMLKRAKQLAPRGPTGLLRKSLGRKIKTYRRSGVVVAILGPRKGFRKVVNGKPVDPVRYAHLVELGRGAVAVKKARILSSGTKVFGRRVRPAPAKPFLKPAFQQGKKAAEAIIIGIIWNEVRKLAGRAA